ncbi:MAG: acyl-CoA dehydrogenase family protein, partial [Halobacteriales archaeon]|nr:acyl-CoA dehydrogenase family protein [Halobacteriales archaeon]
MPFALSDEQELIRKTARDLAEQVLAQHAEPSDRAGTFPKEAGVALGELGLLGLLAPAEHGGAGLDAVSFVVMLEELARRSGGIACAVLSQNLAARALASAPGHAAWVAKLAMGQVWGSLSLADGPLAAQLHGADML